MNRLRECQIEAIAIKTKRQAMEEKHNKTNKLATDAIKADRELMQLESNYTEHYYNTLEV